MDRHRQVEAEITMTAIQFDILAAACQSAERNRIYRGVKAIYDATPASTGHAKAQRIAYRRVLNIITGQSRDQREAI
jgi:hypothetical protein